MAKKKAESQAPEQWRNRIVGEAEVLASELVPHEWNWRTHPKAQKDALSDVLDQVGWVQRVVVNRRSGKIVDGHARVELCAARGETVPVVYVDLSDQEEALILATLDPLGAMAGKDSDKLAGLVAEIGDLTSVSLNDLLGNVSHIEFKEFDENAAADVKYVDCPKCGEHFPA